MLRPASASAAAVLAFVALAAGATAPAARADDPPAPDLSRFADLERLAWQVERDGFGRFGPVETLGSAERPPALLAADVEKLAFDLDAATADPAKALEKEKAFLEAWRAAYRAATHALVEEATELARSAGDVGAAEKDLEKPAETRYGPLLKAALKKQKKSKAAAEIALVLEAAAPRFAELEKLAGAGAAAADPAKVLKARETELKKFLKRYDFGPKIATATAVGTALVEVKLAPDTWELVRRHVTSWKFEPLIDPATGKQVVLGGKMKVERTEQLQQNELREALRLLANELFVVRYAKIESDKETNFIRVTGAKLLFGTYYFIEMEDRLIVAREPAAG